MKLDLALPLFSLVDRAKIDPEKSDLADLAGEIGAFLTERHAIEHEAVSIEGGVSRMHSDSLFLVLLGVPENSWPAFLALAETQRAKPFVFRSEADGRFSLHPLGRHA